MTDTLELIDHSSDYILKFSAESEKIADAFITAQSMFAPFKADSVADIKSDKASFKYKYADLGSIIDATRPYLNANGIALLQGVSNDQGTVTVETMLLHRSGQWMRSRLSLRAQQTTPQAIGSASTYARRYGLQAILGLAADDDDGKGATEKGKQEPRQQQKPLDPEAQKAADDLAKSQHKIHDFVRKHKIPDERVGDMMQAIHKGPFETYTYEQLKKLYVALVKKFEPGLIPPKNGAQTASGSANGESAPAGSTTASKGQETAEKAKPNGATAEGSRESAIYDMAKENFIEFISAHDLDGLLIQQAVETVTRGSANPDRHMWPELNSDELVRVKNRLEQLVKK
jgi:hypothetical protein